MNFTRLMGVFAMMAVLVMLGCSSENKKKANHPNKKKNTNHTHGTGPNGGVVFDLGKYHAEFTVDHDKKECTILFLKDDEKTPIAVAAKELTLNIKETKTEDGKKVDAMTVKMMPKEAADGKASRFVGTDPGIGNVADFAGTVSAKIDGKPAKGDFKE